MRLLNLGINFIADFCPHLGTFLLFFSLRFGQVSPLAIFRWLTATLDRNAKPCNLPPVITSFHSCCLLYHIFDQVTLCLAWVGIETAIFWQCTPGTVETQCLYPLCHWPQRAIKVGFFGLINPIICSPYLDFHSQEVHTEFVIVFYWKSFFEMRLLNLNINFIADFWSPFGAHDAADRGIECPYEKSLETYLMRLVHSYFWSNSLWQGWSCGMVHCPGGNATDLIGRVLASSDGISSWIPLKPQHSIPCWLSVQWEPSACRSCQCCQKKGSSKVCGWICSVWPSWVWESQHASTGNSVSWSLSHSSRSSFHRRSPGHQELRVLNWSARPSPCCFSFWSSLSGLGTNFVQIFSSSWIIVCTVPILTSNSELIVSLDTQWSLSMKFFIWPINSGVLTSSLLPHLIIPHRLSAFLESLMPLKNWCSIHTRWSKSSLKHSICFCGIFSKFKTELYCILFF